MARAKRFKTKYVGVYFIQGKSVIDRKPERIYYIRYKRNGKEVEKKAGREFENNMTAARAAKLRRQKMMEAKFSKSKNKIIGEKSDIRFQDSILEERAAKIHHELIHGERPFQERILKLSTAKKLQELAVADILRSPLTAEDITKGEKRDSLVVNNNTTEAVFEISGDFNRNAKGAGDGFEPDMKLLSDCERLDHKEKSPMKNGLEFEMSLLKEQLEFERLISELSAKFINLPADLVDEEIENAQKKVCEALGFDRSVFMEFSPDLETLKVTHYWRAEGASDFIPIIVSETHPYFSDMLRQGKIVRCQTPEELPETAKETILTLRKVGVTSWITIPFKIGKNIIGGITWESHGKQVTWFDDLVDRLCLVEEIFANALSRKLNEQALRKSIIEVNNLKNRLQVENLYLIDELRIEHSHHKIVGKSLSIRKALSQLEQVASQPSTVLLLGETGTGKELFAHAIHELSPRKSRPMIQVNCSALPSALIENELFGHEKGAYSGAETRRLGRFELAHKSTIFLDEIGELPVELQPKLLRVLQQGQMERLGGTDTIGVDVRLVVATNRDLERAMLEGKFRMDLYYRLNIFPIFIPPLRERVEDIPLLVSAFVKEFSERMGKEVDKIPSETISALQQYDWPGNIRELRNLVERAMIVAKTKTLYIQLPETSEPERIIFEDLDSLQKKHILKALEKCHYRISGPRGASQLLGIHVSTLRSRMKKLGIRHEQLFH